VLHLGNSQFDAPGLQRFISLVKVKGRLPRIVDFYINQMTGLLTEQLARSFVGLQKYTLGTWASVYRVLELAWPVGGFQNIRELDARSARHAFGNCQPCRLHDLFPAFECLTLSLAADYQAVQVLLGVPENAGLIEVVDDVATSFQDSFFWPRHLQLLAVLRGLSAHVLRSRPGLAGILARCENLAVEDAPGVVVLGVPQRVPLGSVCGFQ
jgi:hypothetical protein